MSRTGKFLFAAGTTAIAGLLIYSYRRQKARKALRDVSDHGYETAHDVLYPGRGKSSRTHYGPVIPS